jgi:surfeit locus 1 family protein
MGRYRFLISPGWIIRHLVALALAVALVNLGLWQLRRLHERRDHNAVLAARSAAAVVDVNAGPPAAADSGDLAYREAAATGTYRPDQEVLVRSRSLDGAPGAWVLTPLDLGNGRAVVVNRGWIPASGPPTLPPEAKAPSGPITVRGLLLPTEERGGFGPRDPATGVLPTLARADLPRIQAQVPEQLYPLYVQLEAQDPPLGAPPPQVLPAPERDDGPHLSYAIQWFSFAAMGLVAYGLLIRKIARQRAREAAIAGSADAVGSERASGDLVGAHAGAGDDGTTLPAGSGRSPGAVRTRALGEPRNVDTPPPPAGASRNGLSEPG